MALRAVWVFPKLGYKELKIMREMSNFRMHMGITIVLGLGLSVVIVASLFWLQDEAALKHCLKHHSLEVCDSVLYR